MKLIFYLLEVNVLCIEHLYLTRKKLISNEQRLCQTE